MNEGMNVEFDHAFGGFLEAFGKGRKMVLSTAENDAVTSRMMSIVRLGDQFYFQTDKNFRKYNQLIANPQAALCIDNTQIEGVCKELGHPSQCTAFAKAYQECFPDSYERYTLLQNERVCAQPKVHSALGLYRRHTVY